MASGGKGGAGGGSYNYFGRVAAVVGIGPLTRLHAVLVDGKAIFEGDLDLVEPADVPDDAPVPVPNIDDKYFADSSGYLKLMRGNDEQVMPAEFAHLPNYRGLAVLLFHKFLFGKEKSTVPNIEIIATRTPDAPPALVAGTHNVLDDGQCNPVAFLAEIFTSPFGAFRFDTDRFVAADWLAAAEWCFGRKSRTFCSPFFNSQADARKVAAELLAMFDGALYFDTQGRLGLRLLKPGVAPGSMPLLDAPVWSEGGAPKQDGLGWSEIPARIDVEFTDRDRKYKNAPEPAKNLIASRVLGLEDTRTVSMPHITRRTQAADWGNELVRRSLKPASPIKLSVRRSIARAMNLEPGKKALVDIDPEPGGAGLAQLCVIEETSVGPTGPMKLTVRPDTLSEATPYAPDYEHEPGELPAVDSIVHALVIPLPPLGFPGPLSFGVLATRPQADIIGMRVFFDAEEDGDYAELGTQTGFAARATLEDPIDDSETSVRLELADGDDGIDAYLAGLTAHSEIAALTDVLFIVLANLNSEDGPVTIDADGRPEMEILSVVSRSPVSPGVHDYTVIRGRRGLSPRAWDDCAAWIIPGASLVSWSHETLSTLLDSSTTGYVRLVAYRADAEDEGPSLPTRPITLPPSYDFAPKIDWDTPSTTDGSGNVTVAFNVTDAEGDLVTVRLERRLVDGSDIEVLLERAGMPLTGTFSYSQSTSFTVGTWMLTLTVTDAAGHTRQVVRHVTRAEDGSTILPPQFVPGAPMFGAYTFYVNAPNAPYVEMGWSWIGVSTPTYSQGGHASGIQWGAYGGRRIWSRAYDIIAGVPTYSEWVFIDV